MSIVLQSTGGGSITINEPNTASNFTLSLPAETATVLTSNTDLSAIVKTSLNATGSAPIYAARAWVNWNGTDNTIRASGNVSSITVNTTGDWTINFTTAMPDVNYSLAGYAGFFGNTTAWVCGRPNGASGDYTTTSARVVTSYQNTALTAYTGYVTVSFFR